PSKAELFLTKFADALHDCGGRHFFILTNALEAPSDMQRAVTGVAQLVNFDMLTPRQLIIYHVTASRNMMYLVNTTNGDIKATKVNDYDRLCAAMHIFSPTVVMLHTESKDIRQMVVVGPPRVSWSCCRSESLNFADIRPRLRHIIDVGDDEAENSEPDDHFIDFDSLEDVGDIFDDGGYHYPNEWSGAEDEEEHEPARAHVHHQDVETEQSDEEHEPRIADHESAAEEEQSQGITREEAIKPDVERSDDEAREDGKQSPGESDELVTKAGQLSMQEDAAQAEQTAEEVDESRKDDYEKAEFVSETRENNDEAPIPTPMSPVNMAAPFPTYHNMSTDPPFGNPSFVLPVVGGVQAYLVPQQAAVPTRSTMTKARPHDHPRPIPVDQGKAKAKQEIPPKTPKA
ncbi:hypothetical protein PFISCL1PPCAC_20401, partial [Pristionchus fissidentatus]